MPRFRPRTLDHHARTLVAPLRDWRIGHASLDAYLARHGLPHLVALGELATARKSLLRRGGDLSFLAAFLHSWDAFVVPLACVRAVGLVAFARRMARLQLPSTSSRATFDEVRTVADFLREAGMPDAAEPMANWLVATAEQLDQDEVFARLAALQTLAHVQDALGRPDAAEATHRRLVARAEAAYGPDHRHTLSCVSNLGSILWTLERLDEAEAWMTRDVDTHVRLHGTDAPAAVDARSNLANVYSDQGRLEEALELHRGVHLARARTLGDHHPETLRAARNVAADLQRMDREPEAEPLLRATLARSSSVLGETHPDTLACVQNLATLCACTGAHAEAVQLARRALAGWTHNVSRDHPYRVAARASLQEHLEALALSLLASDTPSEALAVVEELFPPGPPRDEAAARVPAPSTTDALTTLRRRAARRRGASSEIVVALDIARADLLRAEGKHLSAARVRRGVLRQRAVEDGLRTAHVLELACQVVDDLNRGGARRAGRALARALVDALARRRLTPDARDALLRLRAMATARLQP